MASSSSDSRDKCSQRTSKAWAVKAFYDVVEYKFDLVKEYIEEYGEDLNYERFLNLVGIVTCKVTPTSPKYNNYIKGTVPFSTTTTTASWPITLNSATSSPN